MSDYPTVRVDHNGPVTTIIIDRPEVRNAVDRPTAEALAHAFTEFEKDAKASVAVLFGAGGYFCAGADLKGVAEGRGNRATPPAQNFNPLAVDAPMGPTRMRLSKPVIAAVAGHAVAGGLELACWCDMRVVEQDAVFGVFCRRWGVPLIDGGTVRLPRIIGQGRALDMILTGRPVSAAEALSWGLADRVAAPGGALAMAQKLAAEIARFPQLCLRTDRASAFAQWDSPLAEALTVEAHGGVAPLRAEAAKGAARFAAGAGRGGSFEG